MSSFALAYADALRVRDEAEERRAQEAENAATEAATSHVYDPRPYAEAEPTPSDWYVGTGIGALYDLPGCAAFLPELGDWTIGKETS